MPLSERKFCSHCGANVTESNRRIVRIDLEYKCKGISDEIGKKWFYLCLPCYVERQKKHIQLDNEFLSGGKNESFRNLSEE